ncbi:MAG TPA: hypothetical protein VJ721_02885 [Chthoniobacterales bacterium]|nr:hypothetical protein [Chthoniobacterales bacterium]
MLDRENRIALFWTRTINNLPNHIRSAPLRTIFGWWLEAHGRILIHAGAVAKQNRAVLLIGPGGSGKSTAALLCLKTGWKYLADDYCVVDQSEGNDLPTVFSLYQTAKISKDWLSRLNVIESDASEPVDNKQLIFVDEIFPDQMECSARCCAGLLPIVSKEMRTGIVPATNGEAVRALAPTSMFQNAMAAEPAFRLIVRFVVRLPIARLQLGQNLDEIPRQIDNHLRMVP